MGVGRGGGQTVSLQPGAEAAGEIDQPTQREGEDDANSKGDQGTALPIMPLTVTPPP